MSYTTNDRVRAALLAFYSGDMDWDVQDEARMRLAIAAAYPILTEEVDRLRDCLETITGIHGTNPSLPYADVPEADYLKHVLWEVRQLAREALKGDGE
ncbi:hypothetical protein ELI01_18885 [Rhizobium leguminosarum]|uniref:hypothetical protein n=1 Tax=Rhizobium leguminosarum TaxID=384 RepID=UPI001031A473|nr:hypothetical protein [Rhizobium leguminosarum]TAX57144.1 hypothetical protein ELI01_18885 [Rhizobium leguminosarum]